MATKDVLRVIHTSEAKVGTIAVKYGQLIFAEDARKVYFDGDTRICYDAIIKLADEDAREALTQPIVGFYFTVAEGVLWYYTGLEWKKITSDPQEQVQFYEHETDLPGMGDTHVLYVVGNKIYRWFSGRDAYSLIEADVDLEWEEV